MAWFHLLPLLALLQAGRRVKALAKHPVKQLAAAAAELVAAWKELVRKEVDSGAASGAAAASLATSAAGSSKGGAALPRAASQSTVGQADELGSQPASQQTVGGGGSSGAPPAAAAGPPLDLSGLARTGDNIRDKCRQNLAQVRPGGGWGRGSFVGVIAALLRAAEQSRGPYSCLGASAWRVRARFALAAAQAFHQGVSSL